MTEEIEIFEERFQATKEEITTVVDNFIKHRDFDGIEFVDLIMTWEKDTRMYYGLREGYSSRYDRSHLLGYLEIAQLKRLSAGGVRLRIVCVWPPLLKYWQELPGILKDYFAIIEKDASIGISDKQDRIDLTIGRPGRTSDPDYDEAFNRLMGGEDWESVFRWWCEKSKLSKPSKYDRNRFKAAIKYRENKS